MKNKRVLYIFLTLLFLVVATLLSSVLFAVKRTSLALAGQSSNLDSSQIKVLLDRSIGKNIFLIDEGALTEELERAHPYIRVISIERIFPSELKLHFSERQLLFDIKLSDGRYAVADFHKKVLEVRDTPSGGVLLDMALEDAAPCQSLSGHAIDAAALFFEAFYGLTEGDLFYDEYLFKSYFKKIGVSSNTLLIETRLGAKIEILNYNDPDDNLTSKTYFALMVLDERLTEKEKTSSTIIISSKEAYVLK
ncbi:MAG: FtsQ-type POTRA domain-containing protein [Clostridiales bacterium]|jgi:hypothetical protein|nr:FtsQ-type POTRA domain-containing protein [Clostridiales bacterium]